MGHVPYALRTRSLCPGASFSRTVYASRDILVKTGDCVVYPCAQRANIPVLPTTRSVMQRQSFQHIMHFNAAMATIVIIRIAGLWVRILDVGHLVFGVEVTWEANVGKVEVHTVLVFVIVLYDALTDVIIAQVIVAL